MAQEDGDRGGSSDTRDQGLLGVLARRSFGETCGERGPASRGTSAEEEERAEEDGLGIMKEAVMEAPDG